MPEKPMPESAEEPFPGERKFFPGALKPGANPADKRTGERIL
jgi:hypothetical protein